MQQRQTGFEARWTAAVRRLPTICPPLAPTVAAAVLIPVFIRLGLSAWLCGVGLALFALAPQWYSCIAGLMDFTASAGVTVVGLVAAVRHAAA